MRVAVTGAGGFIGSTLIKRLRADGIQTIEISRRPGNMQPGTIGALDVTQDKQQDKLVDVLETIDVVVHTVGLAHLPGSRANQRREEFYKINIGAAEIVANACKHAGVSKLINISSVKALADSSSVDKTGSPVRLTDSDRPHPVDDYGRSKLRAEDLLEEILEPTQTRVFTLRPPLVYGVSQKGNLARLFNMLQAVKPFPFLCPDLGNSRSMLSVNNLCDAIMKVMVNEHCEGGRYLLSDVDISTLELIRAIGSAVNTPVYRIPSPNSLQKVFRHPRFASSSLPKLAGSLVVDNSRFCADFAWQPPFEFRRVLADIARQEKSS